MISWRGNYSDMASPAVSKDMDFPQTQEVRWGYRSDRVSWREAAKQPPLYLMGSVGAQETQ